MKTEELQKLGLTEDQIKFVMAENGKDVNAAKGDSEVNATTITNLQTDKTTLQATINDLQGKLEGFKGVDVSELQGKIAALTTDLQTAKTESEKKELLHSLEKNVDTFLGDKQFVNDITRDSIRGQLLAELDKNTAKGKSTADIFNSIVNGDDGKPLPNILVDTQAQGNAAKFTTPAFKLPPVGTKLSSAEIMKLKNQYPDMDVTQYL